jgi:hypothetical protein
MANNTETRFISADDHIDLRWLPQDLWTQRLPEIATLKSRRECSCSNLRPV